MNPLLNRIRLVTLSLLLLLPGLVPKAAGQHRAAEYQRRAESMYALVWQRYQVPAHKGLFTENYPSNRADTLTYMQGGGVQEKAVSFLWPFSGMFSATNALLKIPAGRKKYLPYLSTLVTGVEKYRDTLRTPPGYQAYPVQFEKSDRYYDDNGLVAIDYMEAYFNTKNPVYLRRAQGVFTFIVSGWNEDAGGGVTWLEGHNDQKPACTNGMATLAALKIYQGSKNRYYLDWGRKLYGWMYQNLRDSTGVYSNDKKLDGKVNRTFWTYNSGSMLEAGVLLYQLTGEKHYLTEAQQLAKDAYRHFSLVPHPAPHTLKIDLPWFVTVLFRGYEALYRQDGNYQYVGAIEQDLNYAWEHARDANGLFTSSWTANPDELKKPKRLLDEGCIAELYARLSALQKIRKGKPRS
ncbi:glycoside hydrolase family 76 protein [Hymenobacter sp. J193]|uniref:glycoside hydrolase family 76 protein n=1 Tax=Hymenobacter sp. J193 TaxID=2898429 RepID=UPI002150B97F|nr:glycoside hydrolase family 76 protein [Hymenobacter sp. J193]MCR5890927.1 glycoside hydrolase family 76 protein [Hymenobacter sp. J193]